MPYMERNFLVEEDGESRVGIGAGKRKEGNVNKVGTRSGDGADNYGGMKMGRVMRFFSKQMCSQGGKELGWA